MSSSKLSPTELLAQPLTLPCGLVLANRLIKCPMQETLAEPPFYDPPIHLFKNLYGGWANSKYGLIITGQVQIDIRYLSVAGDVVCHADAFSSPHFDQWKKWSEIAQSGGIPAIVQLAHPGRMSPAGCGNRPSDLPPLCPSSVPVQMGESWLDKMAVKSLLGVPREMTIKEIDDVVEGFLHGARVAKAAGFKGVQLHAAHGFLLSQFLSPYTNRRTDAYGGTPLARMTLLIRLLTSLRAEHPRPFCLSVKINSGDYMAADTTGLTQDEALEQVTYLLQSDMVDFVELSGGNAEQRTSGLHNSFVAAPKMSAPVIKESTRIREAFYTTFAERVSLIPDKKCPVQLSGGFRSRTGMADALASGACDMIGLGRTTILEPDLPLRLLDPSTVDEDALATPHQVKGLWLADLMPVKVVGAGLPVQVFYYNMRRLGLGLGADPNISIPGIVWGGVVDGIMGLVKGVIGWFGWVGKGSGKKVD